MKAKIAMFLVLSSLAVGVQAAPVEGGAAGEGAFGLSKGATDAVGVGAVAALAGVLAASAGGGNGSNTGTTTTTTTSTTR
ncbi:exopolysaccharide production protein YjbE [Erwiniaceae bacterium CAU 1747]